MQPALLIQLYARIFANKEPRYVSLYVHIEVITTGETNSVRVGPQ